jgi:hypothetical protein
MTINIGLRTGGKAQQFAAYHGDCEGAERTCRGAFGGMGCALSDIIGSKMVAALVRGVSKGRRVLAGTEPANLEVRAWCCASP